MAVLLKSAPKSYPKNTEPRNQLENTTPKITTLFPPQNVLKLYTPRLNDFPNPEICRKTVPQNYNHILTPELFENLNPTSKRFPWPRNLVGKSPPLLKACAARGVVNPLHFRGMKSRTKSVADSLPLNLL